MDAKGDAVRKYVGAPPDLVYRMVSDITRMGEWSPETYACQWVDGSVGPVVGARFKAWNRRGRLRWSNTPEVTAAEPGREFAFVRTVMGFPVRWRYTMKPDGNGTALCESYELLRATPRWADGLADRLFGIQDRERELRDGMRQTLERIAAAAERATSDTDAR